MRTFQPSVWKDPETDEEWLETLGPQKFGILRRAGTDPPFQHELVRSFPKDGYFACAGCALPLYSCDAKFPSEEWPAWDKCFFSDTLGCHLGCKNDGYVEIHCMRCKGHLGHVFYAQPTATGERH
eukprot:TRINITY_DN32723_c0_g1_i1.p1 TRINITY_DN32723_c0_g1~~TRINITY_DN32723_c0_g1_i1.p1  ORF type:complete len:125 (-),score=11.53 TRINITY_DN32723_c0_g1_i1:76-450(-)